MQAQDRPVKRASHTWGCCREGGHKNSSQLIVWCVDMTADGLDGFLFCFFPGILKDV